MVSSLLVLKTDSSEASAKVLVFTKSWELSIDITDFVVCLKQIIQDILPNKPANDSSDLAELTQE